MRIGLRRNCLFSNARGLRYRLIAPVSVIAVVCVLAQFGLSGNVEASRRDQAILDLTQPSVAQAESEQSWGCAGGGLVSIDGHVILPPPLPLSLRVATLGEKTYRLGEEIASELILTNTGKAAIAIPWSVDMSLIFSQGCKWVPRPGVKGLHGMIALVFEDQYGRKNLIAGHNLYGVSSDPATYRKLTSGQSIRIKTSGRLNLYKSIVRGQKGIIPLRLPAQVSVTAEFTLDDGPGFGTYRPVTSINKLEVTVQR